MPEGRLKERDRRSESQLILTGASSDGTDQEARSLAAEHGEVRLRQMWARFSCASALITALKLVPAHEPRRCTRPRMRRSQSATECPCRRTEVPIINGSGHRPPPIVYLLPLALQSRTHDPTPNDVRRHYVKR